MVTMSATSPQWRMPSGLGVGLTRGEVIRILGRVPNGHTAMSQGFAIPVCTENQGDGDRVVYNTWYALIEFGLNKRVSRILFVTSSE